MSLLEFLIPTALAEGSASQGGFTSFIPLILLVVVFYFLLIRPQQKRAKDHKSLLSNLAVGDEVLTNGGIICKILAIDSGDENYLSLEIAKGVAVKAQKQSINQRMPKGTYGK